MLKPQLSNKDTELAVDFGGTLVTRDHLLRVKHQATEELAREKDPAKANEAAMLLARVNTALDLFRQIDEAKAEAEPLRQRLQAEEAAVADQERLTFEGFCQEIARPALQRLADLTCDRSHTIEERGQYLKAVSDYSDLLREKLVFADAEKQAIEIRTADKERRQWQTIVRLPNPENVPLKEGQGRLLPKIEPGVIPAKYLTKAPRG